MPPGAPQLEQYMNTESGESNILDGFLRGSPRPHGRGSLNRQVTPLPGAGLS